MAWRDDDEFERIEDEMTRFFFQASESMESLLFDVESRSLKPLFRIVTDDDNITVTFDLPGAKKDDIAITCTEDVLAIEAEMVRPVKLRVPGAHQTKVEFQRYYKKLRLPLRVDPNKGSAKFKNGMIIVRLPLLRQGKAIKIGAGEAEPQRRE